MGLMRSILLWGSRSQALRTILPRYRFVRNAVACFMPGEDIDDALRAAEALRPYGISAVVTHLGENLQDESEANAVAEHYLDVLARIDERRLDCQISLKLTQLGFDFREGLCAEHLETILRQAKDAGNFVWIDMESSAYVDRTLNLYATMRSKYANVGVCIQSYLFRTATDLERLLPFGPSIRLVKGTYAEPRDVAFRSKRDVDENFYALGMHLLESFPRNRTKIGIATHDLPLIQRIAGSASRKNIPRDAFELQMLYGIKREQQIQLAKDGFRVRVLISYGSFWFPWYMRRLAERPANVLFVLKNIGRG